MIGAFLAAEFSSPRFGKTLRAEMKMHVVAPTIVTAPDVHNDAENAMRRFLLAGSRGFGRDIGVFYRFPSSVQWYRAALDRQELSRVRCIDDEYWVELSGGSRLPGLKLSGSVMRHSTLSRNDWPVARPSLR